MSLEKKIANVRRVGIDIAKSVFQLHGVDAREGACFRKRIQRDGLLRFTQQLSPCLIAMESCSGSHFWGREFVKQGHQVKLLPAQHVKPFVRSKNKDDRVDAEAICEASGRPNIKAVPIKSHDQLDLQAIHRHRRQLIKRVTQLSNQIRGFLCEYGIVIPKGIKYVPERLPEILGDEDNGPANGCCCRLPIIAGVPMKSDTQALPLVQAAIASLCLLVVVCFWRSCAPGLG